MQLAPSSRKQTLCGSYSIHRCRGTCVSSSNTLPHVLTGPPGRANNNSNSNSNNSDNRNPTTSSSTSSGGSRTLRTPVLLLTSC